MRSKGSAQPAGAGAARALAAAALRALATEKSSPQPRPEFVEDYARWMHDMFGEGWQGNRRVELRLRDVTEAATS